jgi:hypothetical protein
MHSHLGTEPGLAEDNDMNTARSFHTAFADSNADHYAIYDQLPPVPPRSGWRRAFPTITQLAASIRHHDERAAA